MTDLLAYRFGLNYTPSRNWWYCWNDFDAGSIARDLDAVASLGADHIRIMAIWPYFQPDPAWVSPAHLQRLDVLMGLAGERGLDVCPAMLTGHLTGQNFRPGYEKRLGAFYTSPDMFDAQALLFRQTAAVLCGHDNFLGWDIGNEINCCWRAETDVGDAWFVKIMDLAESLCPDGVHVNGVDHHPWFEAWTFSARLLARRQRIAALHSWMYFTGALERGGPLEPPCVDLAAAMTALARSFAGDPAKPVWIQEYGASEAWVDAKIIPEFLERATLRAIDAGASWFTWWASHDIDAKFKVQTLEYSLGLLTADGRPKPQAGVFKAIAEAYRGRKVPTGNLQASPPPPPQPHEHERTWQWLLERI
jgi:hypothetical protein